MSELISRDGIKYIIRRLLQNAREGIADEKAEGKYDAFSEGRILAYYEMLNIMRNELLADDEVLHELGLDIDIDKEILG